MAKKKIKLPTIGFLFGLIIIGAVMFLIFSGQPITLAYVPNAAEGTISVIDTTDNVLVDTIKIGTSVSHGIAVTPDGKKIYTGNLEDGQLFVYDIKSGVVLKTIDTGRNLHGIDITPDGKYVFTASGALEEGEEFNYISIIATKSDEIIKTIKSKGKSPSHIDFTKDSKIAFVNNVMSGEVSVIDIATFETLNNIKVGTMPNESELSPDDKYLYVANVQDGTISIVDVEMGKEINKIQAGEGTHGVAVSADGKYVWTTNKFSKDVSVIDLSTKSVIKTISTGGEANHISTLPGSNYAYISNMGTEDITIIDMTTMEVLEKIEVGSDPHEIAFVKIKM